MADTAQDLSAVTNALAQNYRPRVVRTINRRSVFLKTLNITPGEGKNIAVDVEFDGMVAENFTDGADVANFGSDAVAPATLGFGLYRANFHVTDQARAAARRSASPLGLIKLLARNVVNASAKLSSTLNGAAYSGTGSGTTMTGVDTAIATGNTYMGIDRTQSGNAGFRGNVIDPGSPTAPTIKLIRGDINDTIYTACGEQPDIALCSPTVFNTLGDLFTDIRRYNQEVTEIETRGGKRVVLDASVGALQFEGCTFIKDKDCTANEIVYLNTQYCRFEYLPQQDDEEMQYRSENMDLEDGFGPVPLGAQFYELGRTGASTKMSMQVFLNLVIEKPNACGRRVNVLTS